MARKTLADLKPRTDPNADLIGLKIQAEEGVLTVTGSPRWSSEWVLCECGDFLTARSVGLIRANLLARRKR